ncbi:MAG: hypothetical protein AB7F28_05700 [Candidatus Margulisiibacteriota bacterium]
MSDLGLNASSISTNSYDIDTDNSSTDGGVSTSEQYLQQQAFQQNYSAIPLGAVSAMSPAVRYKLGQFVDRLAPEASVLPQRISEYEAVVLKDFLKTGYVSSDDLVFIRKFLSLVQQNPELADEAGLSAEECKTLGKTLEELPVDPSDPFETAKSVRDYLASSYGLSPEELNYRQRAYKVTDDSAAAKAVVQELVASGVLSANQSDSDMASAVLSWVQNNISYKSDGKLNYWQSADETLLLKTGDCEDIAIVQASILMNALKLKGYSETDIYNKVTLAAGYLGDEQNNSVAHALVKFKADSGDVLALDGTGNLPAVSLDELNFKLVFEANEKVFVKYQAIAADFQTALQISLPPGTTFASFSSTGTNNPVVWQINNSMQLLNSRLQEVIQTPMVTDGKRYDSNLNSAVTIAQTSYDYILGPDGKVATMYVPLNYTLGGTVVPVTHLTNAQRLAQEVASNTSSSPTYFYINQIQNADGTWSTKNMMVNYTDWVAIRNAHPGTSSNPNGGVIYTAMKPINLSDGATDTEFKFFSITKTNITDGGALNIPIYTTTLRPNYLLDYMEDVRKTISQITLLFQLASSYEQFIFNEAYEIGTSHLSEETKQYLKKSHEDGEKEQQRFMDAMNKFNEKANTFVQEVGGQLYNYVKQANTTAVAQVDFQIQQFARTTDAGNPVAAIVASFGAGLGSELSDMLTGAFTLSRAKATAQLRQLDAKTQALNVSAYTNIVEQVLTGRVDPTTGAQVGGNGIQLWNAGTTAQEVQAGTVVDVNGQQVQVHNRADQFGTKIYNMMSTTTSSELLSKANFLQRLHSLATVNLGAVSSDGSMSTSAVTGGAIHDILSQTIDTNLNAQLVSADVAGAAHEGLTNVYASTGFMAASESSNVSPNVNQALFARAGLFPGRQNQTQFFVDVNVEAINRMRQYVVNYVGNVRQFLIFSNALMARRREIAEDMVGGKKNPSSNSIPAAVETAMNSELGKITMFFDNMASDYMTLGDTVNTLLMSRLDLFKANVNMGIAVGVTTANIATVAATVIAGQIIGAATTVFGFPASYWVYALSSIATAAVEISKPAAEYNSKELAVNEWFLPNTMQVSGSLSRDYNSRYAIGLDNTVSALHIGQAPTGLFDSKQGVFFENILVQNAVSARTAFDASAQAVVSYSTLPGKTYAASMPIFDAARGDGFLVNAGGAQADQEMLLADYYNKMRTFLDILKSLYDAVEAQVSQIAGSNRYQNHSKFDSTIGDLMLSEQTLTNSYKSEVSTFASAWNQSAGKDQRLYEGQMGMVNSAATTAVMALAFLPTDAAARAAVNIGKVALDSIDTTRKNIWGDYAGFQSTYGSSGQTITVPPLPAPQGVDASGQVDSFYTTDVDYYMYVDANGNISQISDPSQVQNATPRKVQFENNDYGGWLDSSGNHNTAAYDAMEQSNYFNNDLGAGYPNFNWWERTFAWYGNRAFSVAIGNYPEGWMFDAINNAQHADYPAKKVTLMVDNSYMLSQAGINVDALSTPAGQQAMNDNPPAPPDTSALYNRIIDQFGNSLFAAHNNAPNRTNYKFDPETDILTPPAPSATTAPDPAPEGAFPPIDIPAQTYGTSLDFGATWAAEHFHNESMSLNYISRYGTATNNVSRLEDYASRAIGNIQNAGLEKATDGLEYKQVAYGVVMESQNELQKVMMVLTIYVFVETALYGAVQNEMQQMFGNKSSANILSNVGTMVDTYNQQLLAQSTDLVTEMASQATAWNTRYDAIINSSIAGSKAALYTLLCWAPDPFTATGGAVGFKIQETANAWDKASGFIANFFGNFIVGLIGMLSVKPIPQVTSDFLSYQDSSLQDTDSAADVDAKKRRKKELDDKKRNGATLSQGEQQELDGLNSSLAANAQKGQSNVFGGVNNSAPTQTFAQGMGDNALQFGNKGVVTVNRAVLNNMEKALRRKMNLVRTERDLAIALADARSNALGDLTGSDAVKAYKLIQQALDPDKAFFQTQLTVARNQFAAFQNKADMMNKAIDRIKEAVSQLVTGTITLIMNVALKAESARKKNASTQIKTTVNPVGPQARAAAKAKPGKAGAAPKPPKTEAQRAAKIDAATDRKKQFLRLLLMPLITQFVVDVVLSAISASTGGEGGSFQNARFDSNISPAQQTALATPNMDAAASSAEGASMGMDNAGLADTGMLENAIVTAQMQQSTVDINKRNLQKLIDAFKDLSAPLKEFMEGLLEIAKKAATTKLDQKNELAVQQKARDGVEPGKPGAAVRGIKGLHAFLKGDPKPGQEGYDKFIQAKQTRQASMTPNQIRAEKARDFFKNILRVLVLILLNFLGARSGLINATLYGGGGGGASGIFRSQDEVERDFRSKFEDRERDQALKGAAAGESPGSRSAQLAHLNVIQADIRTGGNLDAISSELAALKAGVAPGSPLAARIDAIEQRINARLTVARAQAQIARGVVTAQLLEDAGLAPVGQGVQAMTALTQSGLVVGDRVQEQHNGVGGFSLNAKGRAAFEASAVGRSAVGRNILANLKSNTGVQAYYGTVQGLGAELGELRDLVLAESAPLVAMAADRKSLMDQLAVADASAAVSTPAGAPLPAAPPVQAAGVAGAGVAPVLTPSQQLRQQLDALQTNMDTQAAAQAKLMDAFGSVIDRFSAVNDKAVGATSQLQFNEYLAQRAAGVPTLAVSSVFSSAAQTNRAVVAGISAPLDAQAQADLDGVTAALNANTAAGSTTAAGAAPASVAGQAFSAALARLNSTAAGVTSAAKKAFDGVARQFILGIEFLDRREADPSIFSATGIDQKFDQDFRARAGDIPLLRNQVLRDLRTSDIGVDVDEIRVSGFARDFADIRDKIDKNNNDREAKRALLDQSAQLAFYLNGEIERNGIDAAASLLTKVIGNVGGDAGKAVGALVLQRLTGQTGQDKSGQTLGGHLAKAMLAGVSGSSDTSLREVVSGAVSGTLNRNSIVTGATPPQGAARTVVNTLSFGLLNTYLFSDSKLDLEFDSKYFFETRQQGSGTARQAVRDGALAVGRGLKNVGSKLLNIGKLIGGVVAAPFAAVGGFFYGGVQAARKSYADSQAWINNGNPRTKGARKFAAGLKAFGAFLVGGLKGLVQTPLRVMKSVVNNIRRGSENADQRHLRASQTALLARSESQMNRMDRESKAELIASLSDDDLAGSAFVNNARLLESTAQALQSTIDDLDPATAAAPLTPQQVQQRQTAQKAIERLTSVAVSRGIPKADLPRPLQQYYDSQRKHLDAVAALADKVIEGDLSDTVLSTPSATDVEQVFRSSETRELQANDLRILAQSEFKLANLISDAVDQGRAEDVDRFLKRLAQTNASRSIQDKVARALYELGTLDQVSKKIDDVVSRVTTSVGVTQAVQPGQAPLSHLKVFQRFLTAYVPQVQAPLAPGQQKDETPAEVVDRKDRNLDRLGVELSNGATLRQVLLDDETRRKLAAAIAQGVFLNSAAVGHLLSLVATQSESVQDRFATDFVSAITALNSSRTVASRVDVVKAMEKVVKASPSNGDLKKLAEKITTTYTSALYQPAARLLSSVATRNEAVGFFNTRGNSKEAQTLFREMALDNPTEAVALISDLRTINPVMASTLFSSIQTQVSSNLSSGALINLLQLSKGVVDDTTAEMNDSLTSLNGQLGAVLGSGHGVLQSLVRPGGRTVSALLTLVNNATLQAADLPDLQLALNALQGARPQQSTPALDTLLAILTLRNQAQTLQAQVSDASREKISSDAERRHLQAATSAIAAKAFRHLETGQGAYQDFAQDLATLRRTLTTIPVGVSRALAAVGASPNVAQVQNLYAAIETEAKDMTSAQFQQLRSLAGLAAFSLAHGGAVNLQIQALQAKALGDFLVVASNKQLGNLVGLRVPMNQAGGTLTVVNLIPDMLAVPAGTTRAQLAEKMTMAQRLLSSPNLAIRAAVLSEVKTLLAFNKTQNIGLNTTALVDTVEKQTPPTLESLDILSSEGRAVKLEDVTAALTAVQFALPTPTPTTFSALAALPGLPALARDIANRFVVGEAGTAALQKLGSDFPPSQATLAAMTGADWTALVDPSFVNQLHQTNPDAFVRLSAIVSSQAGLAAYQVSFPGVVPLQVLGASAQVSPEAQAKLRVISNLQRHAAGNVVSLVLDALQHPANVRNAQTILTGAMVGLSLAELKSLVGVMQHDVTFLGTILGHSSLSAADLAAGSAKLEQLHADIEMDRMAGRPTLSTQVGLAVKQQMLDVQAKQQDGLTEMSNLAQKVLRAVMKGSGEKAYLGHLAKLRGQLVAHYSSNPDRYKDPAFKAAYDKALKAEGSGAAQINTMMAFFELAQTKGVFDPHRLNLVNTTKGYLQVALAREILVGNGKEAGLDAKAKTALLTAITQDPGKVGNLFSNMARVPDLGTLVANLLGGIPMDQQETLLGGLMTQQVVTQLQGAGPDALRTFFEQVSTSVSPKFVFAKMSVQAQVALVNTMRQTAPDAAADLLGMASPPAGAAPAAIDQYWTDLMNGVNLVVPQAQVPTQLQDDTLSFVLRKTGALDADYPRLTAALGTYNAATMDPTQVGYDAAAHMAFKSAVGEASGSQAQARLVLDIIQKRGIAEAQRIVVLAGAIPNTLAGSVPTAAGAFLTNYGPATSDSLTFFATMDQLGKTNPVRAKAWLAVLAQYASGNKNGASQVQIDNAKIVLGQLMSSPLQARLLRDHIGSIPSTRPSFGMFVSLASSGALGTQATAQLMQMPAIRSAVIQIPTAFNPPIPLPQTIMGNNGTWNTAIRSTADLNDRLRAADIEQGSPVAQAVVAAWQADIQALSPQVLVSVLANLSKDSKLAPVNLLSLLPSAQQVAVLNHAQDTHQMQAIAPHLNNVATTIQSELTAPALVPGSLTHTLVSALRAAPGSPLKPDMALGLLSALEAQPAVVVDVLAKALEGQNDVNTDRILKQIFESPTFLSGSAHRNEIVLALTTRLAEDPQSYSGILTFLGSMHAFGTGAPTSVPKEVMVTMGLVVLDFTQRLATQPLRYPQHQGYLNSEMYFDLIRLSGSVPAGGLNAQVLGTIAFGGLDDPAFAGSLAKMQTNNPRVFAAVVTNPDFIAYMSNTMGYIQQVQQAGAPPVWQTVPISQQQVQRLTQQFVLTLGAAQQAQAQAQAQAQVQAVETIVSRMVSLVNANNQLRAAAAAKAAAGAPAGAMVGVALGAPPAQPAGAPVPAPVGAPYPRAISQLANGRFTGTANMESDTQLVQAYPSARADLLEGLRSVDRVTGTAEAFPLDATTRAMLSGGENGLLGSALSSDTTDSAEPTSPEVEARIHSAGAHVLDRMAATMRQMVLHGQIDRQMLVNYRAILTQLAPTSAKAREQLSAISRHLQAHYAKTARINRFTRLSEVDRNVGRAKVFVKELLKDTTLSKEQKLAALQAYIGEASGPEAGIMIRAFRHAVKSERNWIQNPEYKDILSGLITHAARTSPREFQVGTTVSDALRKLFDDQMKTLIKGDDPMTAFNVVMQSLENTPVLSDGNTAKTVAFLGRILSDSYVSYRGNIRHLGRMLVRKISSAGDGQLRADQKPPTSALQNGLRQILLGKKPTHSRVVFVALEQLATQHRIDVDFAFDAIAHEDAERNNALRDYLDYASFDKNGDPVTAEAVVEALKTHQLVDDQLRPNQMIDTRLIVNAAPSALSTVITALANGNAPGTAQYNAVKPKVMKIVERLNLVYASKVPKAGLPLTLTQPNSILQPNSTPRRRVTAQDMMSHAYLPGLSPAQTRARAQALATQINSAFSARSQLFWSQMPDATRQSLEASGLKLEDAYAQLYENGYLVEDQLTEAFNAAGGFSLLGQPVSADSIQRWTSSTSPFPGAPVVINSNPPVYTLGASVQESQAFVALLKTNGLLDDQGQVTARGLDVQSGAVSFDWAQKLGADPILARFAPSSVGVAQHVLGMLAAKAGPLSSVRQADQAGVQDTVFKALQTLQTSRQESLNANMALMLEQSPALVMPARVPFASGPSSPTAAGEAQRAWRDPEFSYLDFLQDRIKTDPSGDTHRMRAAVMEKMLQKDPVKLLGFVLSYSAFDTLEMLSDKTISAKVRQSILSQLGDRDREDFKDSKAVIADRCQDILRTVGSELARVATGGTTTLDAETLVGIVSQFPQSMVNLELPLGPVRNAFVRLTGLDLGTVQAQHMGNRASGAAKLTAAAPPALAQLTVKESLEMGLALDDPRFARGQSLTTILAVATIMDKNTGTATHMGRLQKTIQEKANQQGLSKAEWVAGQLALQGATPESMRAAIQLMGEAPEKSKPFIQTLTQLATPAGALAMAVRLGAPSASFTPVERKALAAMGQTGFAALLAPAGLNAIQQGRLTAEIQVHMALNTSGQTFDRAAAALYQDANKAGLALLSYYGLEGELSKKLAGRTGVNLAVLSDRQAGQIRSVDSSEQLALANRGELLNTPGRFEALVNSVLAKPEEALKLTAEQRQFLVDEITTPTRPSPSPVPLGAVTRLQAATVSDALGYYAGVAATDQSGLTAAIVPEWREALLVAVASSPTNFFTEIRNIDARNGNGNAEIELRNNILAVMPNVPGGPFALQAQLSPPAPFALDDPAIAANMRTFLDALNASVAPPVLPAVAAGMPLAMPALAVPGAVPALVQQAVVQELSAQLAIMPQIPNHAVVTQLHADVLAGTIPVTDPAVLAQLPPDLAQVVRTPALQRVRYDIASLTHGNAGFAQNNLTAVTQSLLAHPADLASLTATERNTLATSLGAVGADQAVVDAVRGVASTFGYFVANALTPIPVPAAGQPIQLPDDWNQSIQAVLTLDAGALQTLSALGQEPALRANMTLAIDAVLVPLTTTAALRAQNAARIQSLEALKVKINGAPAAPPAAAIAPLALPALMADADIKAHFANGKPPVDPRMAVHAPAAQLHRAAKTQDIANEIARFQQGSGTLQSFKLLLTRLAEVEARA